MPKKQAPPPELRPVVAVAAGSVRPNGYNPNRQNDREFHLLVKSVLEEGFTQPLIVHEATREIVEGEHRWTAWVVCNALLRNADGRKGVYSRAGEALCAQLRSQRDHLLTLMPDLQISAVMSDATDAHRRIATMRYNRARGSEDYELARMVIQSLQGLDALDEAKDSLSLDGVELGCMLESMAASGSAEVIPSGDGPFRESAGTLVVGPGAAPTPTPARKARKPVARGYEELRTMAEVWAIGRHQARAGAGLEPTDGELKAAEDGYMAGAAGL